MSSPGSIYTGSMRSIFPFHFCVRYNDSHGLIKMDTLVLFQNFLEYAHYFLDDNADGESKKYSNSKSSA